MRQAIEEGFILDVLKNYTPYALAFKLANGGEEMDDHEVERSTAQNALMQWVKLHPWNIAQKVAIVVEHYRSMVIPLLDFGREREGVDLSKVELTHHKLIAKDKTNLTLGSTAEKLKPMTESGSAEVQDKEKALLSEILNKMNDLFTGVTDSDQLSYAMAIKGKLMENEMLSQQAGSNQKDQFDNSPLLKKAIMDAVIDALDAHSAMSRQALESQAVQDGLKAALMGPGRLYEALRARVA